MNDTSYSGYTILIAEDNDMNFTFFHDCLAKTGVNILRAKNGMAAVELCRKHPEIGMILMDGLMPTMNGYEATKEIRKFASALPIVILTAYISHLSIHEAVSSGCNDYLSKPISSDALLTAIRKWIVK